MGDHHHARFGHDRSSGVGCRRVVHTDTHTHERYYFIYIEIRSLFDNPQSNNPYSEDASPFPGQAGVQTVPEPPQPHDKSASVRSRERLVCEGGTGAQVSGLAQAQGSNVKNLPKAKIVQPPGFKGCFQDVPSGSGGPRGRREHCFEDDYMNDDDVDDKESLVEAALECAFARLVDYIYERFPHSEPQTAASSAPRCEYESYFSLADPPEPSRKFMRLYPRVSEIQTAISEHAANLSRESRPLFRMLPVKRRALSIGDDPDFCKQRFLNSDFSRICRSKSVPKLRMASVSLADLERLDRVARMVLAGDFQCFWFLSALIAQ